MVVVVVNSALCMVLVLLVVTADAQSCDKSTPYRSYDGSCNNLQHHEWGTPKTTYGRLLPSNYSDGRNAFAKAKDGQSLPNARLLSFTIFPDKFVLDKKFTLALMQYGQILTHDLSLNSLPDGDLYDCCTNSTENLSPYCSIIPVPANDPVFLKENRTCIGFLRTITRGDLDKNLSSQPAQQLSDVTPYLDLSNVYGNDKKLNDQLRQFKGGLLNVEVRNAQEWPLQSQNSTIDCPYVLEEGICYFPSDARINQNTQLTLLQVALLREHNRIARELARINPRWEDEVIFQEARKINIAQHQRISYYEMLPLFLGEKYMIKAGILHSCGILRNNYDATEDPSVLNEHAQAAFRYFHSLIADRLQIMSPARESNESLRMSDWYFRPQALEEGDNFDGLARGLTTQKAWAADRFETEEITNFLFRGKNKLGIDLTATDIHRSRDHGLPSYTAMRRYCGSPKARTFNDLKLTIPDELVEKLKSVYSHPDDIDLVVGGNLERHLPNTLAGPTFHCILLRQFRKTRRADRFWFENAGFTSRQLQELKKASISRLLCDNTRNVKRMQPRGFEVISASNPLVSCDNLPRVNLSMWKYD